MKYFNNKNNQDRTMKNNIDMNRMSNNKNTINKNSNL